MLKPECVKCGSDDVELEWREPNKEWEEGKSVLTKERIECFCNHCGYRWDVAPLEYDEDDPSLYTEEE